MEILFKPLEYYNDIEILINWIKIFYNGCTSTFMNNGKIILFYLLINLI